MSVAAPERPTHGGVIAAACVMAAGILLADLVLPLGTSLPSLYVLVVLLGLWSPRPRFAAAAAAASTALTLLGALLSPAGHTPWMATVNRPTALMVIWLTAFGVARYKRAERRLLEERRQAQAYLDIAAVPIVALDLTDRVVLINPRGCRLVERDAHDVVGRDWVELSVPAAERERARDVLKGLREGRLPPGHAYELRTVTAGGQERLVEWRGTVTRSASGQVSGTLNSGEDTTEKRRAQALLASAMDSAPVTFLAVDALGAITLAEGDGLRRMGFDPSALWGEPCSARFRELPWLAQPLLAALAGEVSTVAGELHGASYEVRATPLRDASGAIIGGLAVSLDVTERLRTEAILHRQQTLARLGELAAVVAHEVRNPLAGIRATIQVLARRLPSTDRDAVKALLARIDALNAMTEDLLLFARPRPLRPTALPLKPLLQEAAGLLTRDKRAAAIAVEIAGEDVCARADALALRGVFLNLLLNASEAMGGAGTIRVSVRGSDSSCSVSIEDAGPGIPRELRDRIFEPFFTTKHRGTGLGLAVVRRQVELHAGEISVSCPPEGGTIVTVTLPREPGGA